MSNSAKKKWTLMVYLARDNNLDANGVTDLSGLRFTSLRGFCHRYMQASISLRKQNGVHS